MEALAAGVSWALNQTVSAQKILGRLGLASLLAHNVTGSWTELASQLSPQASILLPDEPSFDTSISRWREWHAPSVGAVVNVFTESDISATVSLRLNLPGDENQFWSTDCQGTGRLIDDDLHRSGTLMNMKYPSSPGLAGMARPKHCRPPKTRSLLTCGVGIRLR